MRRGAQKRPTPQPSETSPTGERRPRYRDPRPEDFPSPGANPYVESHATYGTPLIAAREAWKLKGAWSEEFGREAPLHVEVGSGNGFFLRDFSKAHPDLNVIGLEIRYKRTVQCADKLRKAGVENARILRYHAAFLDDLFEDGTLEGVYVHHPDPWSKNRHEKNRLVSRWFLEDTARLLKVGGVFRLKSDFGPNVARVPSLLANDPSGAEAPPLPFEITGSTEDLERDGAPWPDDIETNYQRKMIARGEQIHAIELRRTDAPWTPPPLRED